MKTKILLMIAVVSVVGLNVQAAIDWDIYGGFETITNGDEYNDINVYNDATVDVFGGAVHYLHTHDSSSLNVTNGDIDHIRAWGQSIITIEGGIFDSIEPSHDSIFNYSGTSQSTYFVTEGGTSNISGGFVDYIMILADSNVNFYGGEVIDFIAAGNSSIVNIFGNDLEKTDLGGSYGYGQVSGFWADSSPFIIDFDQTETFSHIVLHEIPEPLTFSLFSTGSLILFRTRKSLIEFI